MTSHDPMAAAVRQEISKAFEMAAQQPSLALPHIDKMERFWREAVAESGEPDNGSFQNTIHALRFVAYSRVATLEFERTQRPSAQIAGNCELAIQSYRIARDAGSASDEWQTDGTVNLLELCRPGRAYELLGTIKIKNLARCERLYMCDRFDQLANAGHISRAELEEISDLPLKTERGIVRFAAIIDVGDSATRFVVALFSNPQPLGAAEPGVIGSLQLLKADGRWQLQPLS